MRRDRSGRIASGYRRRPARPGGALRGPAPGHGASRTRLCAAALHLARAGGPIRRGDLMTGPTTETNAVRERYARRPVAALDPRYQMLNPAVWQSVQERQRATLRLLARVAPHDLSQLELLEVGCGSGGNLLELLRLGFDAGNLSGIELLEDRHAQARHALPAALRLTLGDASEA